MKAVSLSFEDTADLAENDQERIFTYYGIERGPRSTQSSMRFEQLEPSETAKLSDDRTFQLKEEQVKIGKRQVEDGGVRLPKIVRTETISQPVEHQREEIVINR
jgi:stress response protein YsnF